MKKIRIEFLPLVLVVLVLFSHIACMAASPFCFGLHVHDMVTRGVEQWIGKLGSALHKNLPSISSTRRTSWLQIADIEDRRIQASADVVRSMGKAEEAAKLAGGAGLGAKTADRYAEILGSGRVLESSADLDKAGKGLGRFSAAKGDDFVDETLVLRKETIDFMNNTHKITFSEADMLVDFDDAMDALPGSELEKLLIDLKGKNNWGPLSELHTIASLKRANIRITTIEPNYFDLNGKPIPRLPVDFVGDNGLVYQNKATAELLEKEFDPVVKPDLVADIIAVEAVHGAGSFKFTYSHGAFADLPEEIRKLNERMKNLGAGRRFSEADFIPLPWGQP